MKISKEILVKSMNNAKVGRWHQSEGQIQQLKVFMGKVILEHWGKHAAGGSIESCGSYCGAIFQFSETI